jgi:hypothetical protein
VAGLWAQRIAIKTIGRESMLLISLSVDMMSFEEFNRITQETHHIDVEGGQLGEPSIKPENFILGISYIGDTADLIC